MESMEVSIAQYRQSIEGVRKRIDQLNEAIDKARKSGRAVKDLQDRRVTLYIELADMHHALASMEEYVELTTDKTRAG